MMLGGAPYWFPAKTEAGAIGEDRIVLPIPPGTHWRDAKPTVLPGLPAPPPQEIHELLPGGQPVRSRPEKPKLTRAQQAALQRSASAHLGGAPLGTKAIIRGGRIRYVPIPGFDPNKDAPDELLPPEKPKREKKPRQKNDPKYVEAARELRDRYLEQVNADRMLPAAQGKYDVSRQLEAGGAPSSLKQAPLLEAA